MVSNTNILKVGYLSTDQQRLSCTEPLGSLIQLLLLQPTGSCTSEHHKCRPLQPPRAVWFRYDLFRSLSSQTRMERLSTGGMKLFKTPQGAFGRIVNGAPWSSNRSQCTSLKDDYNKLNWFRRVIISFLLNSIVVQLGTCFDYWKKKTFLWYENQ